MHCAGRRSRSLLAPVQRIRNSLHLGATRRAKFGFTSCTSKSMSLVWFSNLKFLPRACHQSDRSFKLTTQQRWRSARIEVTRS